MKQIKNIALTGLVLISLFGLAACRESDKVSHNISQEADNFNVIRRVAVINTRTDKIEFEVIGRISVDTEANKGKRLEILVETDKGVYKKHMVNLTGWNMYVVEDIEGAKVNQYKYEINYMPESIVPFDIIKKK
ncbi:hypothetical protein HMPREF2887_05710 [Streptococcus sp. HMSC071H03]|uniref:beta-sandwich lipoprotein n=1 Tax=Streptococcus sp. HMSC071H03 TaxID=1739391 RepID=UPI0008B1B28A|nr:hypothetical protein [Streptococcus sp. HMSC071H03]OFR41653.1 hypothetical protein HMPREF2887_05710 [Streptococcus sp. HMSC071H03]